MSRFRKGNKKTVTAISTASLPDVVFMLLFFFMVTTVMRQAEIKVEINPVSANQLTKLLDKSLVSYIYIGKPINKNEPESLPKIQINDAFVEPGQIQDYILAKQEQLGSSDQNKLTVSLKIDRKVEMGIVTDVKQELRKANALKVSYSAFEGDPVYDLSK